MKIDAGGVRLIVTDYEPGRRMAPHWHPGTQVSMVLRGAVEEGVGRCEHQGTAGALVVKPAGMVHRNVFGPVATRMVSIGIAPWAERELASRAAALQRWRWMDAGEAPCVPA